MILLAGGSGRLGRLLTARLAARGDTVRLMTRAAEHVRASVPAGVTVVPGDVRRAEDVDRAMHGVTAVISAMSAFGMTGVTPRQVDLEGNANLVAAGERHGIGHFILVSALGASPDHPMELSRMKYGAEQRLARSGLSFTILRPSPFIETFQEVLCAPLQATGKTVVFGGAQNPVNFVSVHDVAWCVERALTDPTLRRATIEIGGPENLSLVQFVAAFMNATGTRGSVKHVPLPMMKILARVSKPFAPRFARLVQASVVMDTIDMTFDASPLRTQFPVLALLSASDVARRDYGDTQPSTQA